MPALSSVEARPRGASIAYRKSKGAAGYSVRTERYRYIEWIDLKTAKLVGQDLFDFEREPEGKHNWANDSAYESVVAEMRAHLHADTAGWHLLQRYLAEN